MKKLIFVITLFDQSIMVIVTDTNQVTSARYDNIKLYQQPGTSTAFLKTLKSTDALVVIRKFNNNWSIVEVNNVVGYV